MSGGVNLLPYSEASTVADDRAAWDKIVQKIESGEMPPKGVPRPPQAQMTALVEFLRGEFMKADAAVKPDPGRVTARRLNRNEYRNTIRDLLAVDFRADKDFPDRRFRLRLRQHRRHPDHLAGADGEVPQRRRDHRLARHGRRSAAQEAARNHLRTQDQEPPPPGFQHRRSHPPRRFRRRVHRPLRLSRRTRRRRQAGQDGLLDGRPASRRPSTSKPSLPSWSTSIPFSDAEIRVYLPEGDHVFRAAFLNDDFIKTITDPKDAYSDKKNKFIGSITFVGPFPSKVEKASRKKILICDPKTGQACVEKIVTNLAHHAYRRPVTKTEVAALMKFVAMAKAQGQSTEQGIQLALEAMLVSPEFLFRIERDPNPTDPDKVHRLSDVELASRLSYFLWSSMPDDELLALAEAGKLKDPAVLDAQVKRMMTDKKAAAFAENFAGQWLEIRNLDSIKPDPQKFPAWTPELKEAMRTETSMFFQHVLSENRPHFRLHRRAATPS